MLVSVTDEGYGIWDDNVWVDKGYDTQAGGHTYVPRVEAVYVEG